MFKENLGIWVVCEMFKFFKVDSNENTQYKSDTSHLQDEWDQSVFGLWCAG